MAKVYLGLGSNQQAHMHLYNALTALTRRFGSIETSPVYESRPVGFDGANFLNMVVAIDTALRPEDLLRVLKQIERENGRDLNAPRFTSRTLDIDILTYDRWTGEFGGVQLPRDEILKYAFVLKPFCDIAPHYMHPQTQKTLAEHWAEFELQDQSLWRTYFYWDGGLISRPPEACVS